MLIKRISAVMWFSMNKKVRNQWERICDQENLDTGHAIAIRVLKWKDHNERDLDRKRKAGIFTGVMRLQQSTRVPVVYYSRSASYVHSLSHEFYRVGKNCLTNVRIKTYFHKTFCGYIQAGWVHSLSFFAHAIFL